MNYRKFVSNYFLAERNYTLRKIDISNMPFVFSIEITNMCNLKCTMCPHKDMERHREIMDVEIFENVIDEICDYNGRILLHNLGEPLIHPRYDDMIKYAKKKGLKCLLSTNVTLLDRDRTERIFESGLDEIILCLDGTTKEDYESVRVGANYEHIIDNMENFLRMKKERKIKNPRTIVQMIYMKETDRQLEQFQKQWEPLADRVHLKRFCTWADQVEDISMLSEAKHRYYPARGVSTERYPCAYLWRSVVVAANGDVIPCCVDYETRMVMGNVKQQTLRKIWNGPRFRQTRADHIAGRYTSTCAQCQEWVGSAPSKSYPLSRSTTVRAWNIAKKIVSKDYV